MRPLFPSSFRLAAAVAALAVPAGLARADYTFSGIAVSATTPTAVSTGTITGGPYSAASTLTLTTSGVVNLNTGANTGPYMTNAAGILTATAGPAYGNLPAGSFSPSTPNYGAILVTANGSTATPAMSQFYPANAANGFGSGTPPTSLTMTTTLGALLGANYNYAALTNLSFVVYDAAGQYGDNAGSFTVSGTLRTNAVPEPSSVVLMGMGAVALVGVRLRRGLLTAAA